MKVWVTRDEERDGPLSSALRAAGLEVIIEPVLRRRVLTDAAEVLSRLSPDDWLVLTSVYAIEAVALEPARIPRVAVVGEASRRAALGRGFRVELVGEGGTGKALFRQLRSLTEAGGVHTRAESGSVRPPSDACSVRRPWRTTKVCYPRSSKAPEPPSWPGMVLISPILYETSPVPFDRGLIQQVDAVCVVSPSAVEATGPVDLPLASIGPTTSAAIRRLGKEPWVEAPEPSFGSLARAIAGRAGTADRPG